MIQRIFLLLLLQNGQICHGETQDPTHTDLRYSGDYKRSQLTYGCLNQKNRPLW